MVKKTGGTLCNLRLGKGFLGMTPKVQTIKEQIDKLYFIKIKNIWSSEASIGRMKGQPTDLGRIFAKPICVKGVVSRIYKETSMFSNKKINNLIKDTQRFKHFARKGGTASK